MPVIPATWEAEIGRITVRGQPWANSSQDPISKITSASWAEVWLKQVQSPGSNPSRTKKKKASAVFIQEQSWVLFIFIFA
jgi:hypothetical protein